MVIVDASVLVAFLAGRSNPRTVWLDRELDFQRIGITSITLAEVLQGIRTGEEFVEVLNSLAVFEIFETGSSELAIASARNYRALRQGGVTIRNTIDCLIATFCIENGHELLHDNRDFHGFETHLGLRVVHPEERLHP